MALLHVMKHKGITVMNFNTLYRHIREGVKSILRNGWMSVAAIGAVIVTLILVGVFIAVIFNINHMTKQIEEDVEVKVLIELTADQNEIIELGEEIESIPKVDTVTFSSKEEELDELIEDMGEQGDFWGMFEQDNPLSHAYVIKAKDPHDTEEIASELETYPHISKVLYGESFVPLLFKFTKYARTIGTALVIALVLTAVFLISNTIKLTIMARSREIGIMKLVGATNGFIRWPFFIEGFILGVVGSIIPIVLISTLYQFVSENVSGKTDYEFVQFLPPNPFLWQLSAVIVGIGIFIGVWGSVMSVRKFLKV